MDARAVSEAVGVGVGTLNMWVQRGLIPGMAIGARGRQREFDLDTATHILIMAEMVKLGFGASYASAVAKQRAHDNRLLIVEGAAEVRQMMGRGGKFVMREGQPDASMVIPFNSETTDLPHLLAELPRGRPAVYVVVDIEAMTAKMQHAYDQAHRRRKPRRAVKAPND